MPILADDIRLGLTSVKHEPVNSSFFVSCYAQLFYEILLRTHGHESGQKPTVATTPLVDILRCRSIDEELRIVEDILHSLDPGWRIYFVDSLRLQITAISTPASLESQDQISKNA